MTAVFVHLSDIHFGQDKGGQLVTNDDARNQLIEDAADMVQKISGGKASGIILTGDIAYAGKDKEYTLAGSWLDNLTGRIGCAKSDIQMVPGNHDIDRDKIKGGTAMMLDAIRRNGEAKLDSFLEEEADREVLYLRFADYRRFADAYKCPLDCTGNSSAERTVTLTEGRSIRFVRLNSALACSKGESDFGKLLLGARQRVMNAEPGEELVVLTHHPLNWYAEADSLETSKFLRARARVFISGHEHRTAVEIQQIDAGKDLMLLAAGATTPDKIEGEYTYAYNVIKFDWDETTDGLGVTLYPRVWNDEEKRFEAGDSRLGTCEPRTVLGAPNFRRAPKPLSSAATAKAHNTEPARVDIILARDEMVTDHHIDEFAYQDLHLTFFRDVSDEDRLRIFVELGVLPPGIESGFPHEAESKLLRSVVRANRFEELRAKVDLLVAKRKDEEGEK